MCCTCSTKRWTGQTSTLAPAVVPSLTACFNCRSGDLLYTFTDAEDDMQLFWEAFPAAGGGRTTYMFTYADADAKRPTFEVDNVPFHSLYCSKMMPWYHASIRRNCV
jgi:hypothetical protein